MSRGYIQELAPIELNGVRYEQVDESEPIERRTGFLRAVDIETGKILWEKQVYEVDRDSRFFSDENALDIYMLDVFFKRFMLLPNQYEILIENEGLQFFILDTKTTEIRQVSLDDLPESVKYKPKTPDWTPFLFHRGLMYCQELKDFFLNESPDCGRLTCYDVKTGKELWSERIYTVPPDLSVVGDLRQCYFKHMKWMHTKRDIWVTNQYNQEFLLDIRTRKVRPYEDNYFQTRYSWKGRFKDFLLDIVDFFTRRKSYTQSILPEDWPPSPRP